MNVLPPMPQDPVAQRVAAEKAQLAALVTEPEMEIIGVTSSMGAGAMGSAATDEWSLRLSLLRWREVGGSRCGGELMIRRITNEQDIDRVVDAIPGPTAVRMRVRPIVPPAEPASPLDALPAALLVALLDAPVDDAQMIAFAATLQAEEAGETAEGAADTEDRLPMTMQAFIEAVNMKQPPAPEQAVAAFEDALGCRLPADYRTFLVACNGGYVSGKLGFEGAGPTGEMVRASVHHIGGFREESYFSLAWARSIYAGRIPDELLWIMDTPGGDAICLGLRGAHAGAVVLWDHEAEPDEDWDGDGESAGNIVRLAESFTVFVAGLRPTGL
ncbi:MAG: SMI1/KNR4 family protein [Betaproteobacteria bacterium]|nr:SMI1/KNR4 family protein [Betaproteobacteria bacterium]